MYRQRKSIFQRPAILVMALVFIVALCYVNALFNSFVWDDHFHIVLNDFVKNSGNLKRLFQRNYITPIDQLGALGQKDIGSGELTFRPLTTLSYFADYALWKLEPFGFHLTNVLGHLLNCVLVFYLIRKFLDDNHVAFITALLFGLHPVQTEAVCVISFRDDILAFCFYLSALLFYVSPRQGQPRFLSLRYILSLVCYLLALCAKEMAITLPLVLIAYDVLFLKTAKSRLVKIFSGYAAVGLGFLFVWAFMMTRDTAHITDFFEGNGLFRFWTMVKVLGIYWKLLAFPMGLHATLNDPAFVVRHAGDIRFLSSFILNILIIGAMLVCLRQSRKWPLFSLLWIAITLLPVMNVIRMSNMIWAVRCLYFPSLGFCLLLAYGWRAALLRRHWGFNMREVRILANIILTGLVVFYMSQTFIRTYVWRNDITFQFDRLSYYPRYPLAYLLLAETFRRFNMPDEAADYYLKSLTLGK